MKGCGIIAWAFFLVLLFTGREGVAVFAILIVAMAAWYIYFSKRKGKNK